MDCETIWQVVISTPVPVHYVAPAQAAVRYTTASATGGVEAISALVSWVVTVVSILWFIGGCLAAVAFLWDNLFDPPPSSPTMTSVAGDARRQIDDLSESYARSSARTLFGK